MIIVAYMRSLFLLARLAQLYVLDLVDLLRVDDQFRVEWIQFFCLLKVLRRLLVLLQRLVRECSSEVCMAVFGLQFDDLAIVLQ